MYTVYVVDKTFCLSVGSMETFLGESLEHSNLIGILVLILFVDIVQV